MPIFLLKSKSYFQNFFYNILLKAYDIFLDSARSQFFADGNKRTAQLMMNGYLMQEGYSLFSISPENDVEYKEKLVEYYESGDKEPMIDFLGKLSVQLDMSIDCLN